MGHIRQSLFLRSDLATAEALHAALPDDPNYILDRISLESRVEELREELNALDNAPVTTAEAVLYFYGAPVAEDYGIDAKFSGDVLLAYQDLVAKDAAAQHGPNATSGPVRSERDSHLHVTNIVHGSFGFQLEEIPAPGALPFQSRLVDAVENVSLHIEAASRSDDAFSDLISSIDLRVYQALKTFIGTIYKANAQVRIQSHNRTVELDATAVAAANERTSAEWSEAVDQKYEGIFHGVLSVSRSFEYLPNGGKELIKGKVSQEVDTSDLLKWQGKRCVAHMRVVTLTRGPKQYHNYTLLRITPSDAGGER